MTHHEQHTEEVAAEEAVASDGVHTTTEPEGSEDETGAAAVEADLDELREKAAQRDEYLAIAQRTQADFENYRKRMTREVSLAEGRGVTRLAKELLPALDNLDRAIAAAPAGQDSLTEGFRLVHAELTAALARLGIEGYVPKG